MQEFTFNQPYDIDRPNILTYKQMLRGFAEARGLRRSIFTVLVMPPKLSSYWLYLVTSTSYVLAKYLVDSMGVDVVARENDLSKRLGIEPISYHAQLLYYRITILQHIQSHFQLKRVDLLPIEL